MNENYAFNNFDEVKDAWRQKSLMDFFKRMMQTPSEAAGAAGAQAVAAPSMGDAGVGEYGADSQEQMLQQILSKQAPHMEGSNSGYGQSPTDYEPESGGFAGGRPDTLPSSPRAAMPMPPKKAPEPSAAVPNGSNGRLNGFNRSRVGDLATTVGPKPSPAPKPTQPTKGTPTQAGPSQIPFGADPMSGASPGQGGGFFKLFSQLFGGGMQPESQPGALNLGAPTSATSRAPRPPDRTGQQPKGPYQGSWTDPIGAWKHAVWGDEGMR